MNRFIEHVHAFPIIGEGMDIIILSCSTPHLARHWENHLNQYRGTLIKKSAKICAIVEDWPNGAGNGFGTLYALKKAKELLGPLKGSVAIYHTAGKGTRLAPLTLAENNNKPGVELPAVLPNDIHQRPLSILEMVLLQTAPLAPLMKDRIAVFWSDQLFIPTTPLDKAPSTPVEILAKRIPLPTEENFPNQYGLVTFAGQHLNKLTYSQFDRLPLDLSEGLGVNLGSFSMSKELADTLLSLFADELKFKIGRLDTDNHLWMPATLSKELFLQLRPQDELRYDRMHTLLKNAVSIRDIGHDAWWWDFGTLHNYYHNCMKLLGEGKESDDLRQLFGHSRRSENIIVGSNLYVTEAKKSILMHVNATSCLFDNAICIKSNITQVSVIDSMLYHVSAEKEVFTEGVRADVSDPKKGSIAFYSDLENNTWEEVLPKNPCSFSEQFLRNVIS